MSPFDLDFSADYFALFGLPRTQSLDSAALELLKQYDPELKHRIMLILLAKKASDLGTAQGVQRLSNEIRETVNNTLDPPVPKKGKEKGEVKEPGDVAAPDAPVQAVLFTSFIIQ